MNAINRDSPISLAIQLADVVRDAVRGGEYRPGQPIPSERELCETHQLSRTTVRRAVEILIDEGILERAPGAGTFVGKGRAARPSDAMLGLIVPTLANPFYGQLSDALSQEASQRGYQILLGRFENDEWRMTEQLQRFADNPNVKGILVAPASAHLADPRVYARLQQMPLPALFLVRKPEECDADLVMTDHIGGARAVVGHLIELGHRRIAYIGTSRVAPNRHLTGYREALAAAGIEPHPDLIVEVDAAADEAGRRGVQQLVERRTPFTAIFARTDQAAVWVLDALRAAGLRVPEDVSLVGFDDTEVSRHLQPPLTTVRHPLPELSYMALTMLLDRIAGRYTGVGRLLMIPPRLVVRESSAPAAGASA